MRTRADEKGRQRKVNYLLLYRLSYVANLGDEHHKGCEGEQIKCETRGVMVNSVGYIYIVARG
jgi:hypothetical protein